MTNKLEQMLEKRNKIIKKYDVRYFDGSTYAVGEEFEKDLNSLITEVWNEAIKECEGEISNLIEDLAIRTTGGKWQENDYNFGLLQIKENLALLPRENITSDK